MKTIGINESIHKRIRQLAVITDKKIYILIEEAIAMLEEKYYIIRNIDHHE